MKNNYRKKLWLIVVKKKEKLWLIVVPKNTIFLRDLYSLEQILEKINHRNCE
jgi:hypothetical protein